MGRACGGMLSRNQDMRPKWNLSAGVGADQGLLLLHEALSALGEVRRS